jgi:hypothetical protein
MRTLRKNSPGQVEWNGGSTKQTQPSGLCALSSTTTALQEQNQHKINDTFLVVL